MHDLMTPVLLYGVLTLTVWLVLERPVGFVGGVVSSSSTRTASKSILVVVLQVTVTVCVPVVSPGKATGAMRVVVGA